jgi:hypothetical protein
MINFGFEIVGNVWAAPGPTDSVNAAAQRSAARRGALLKKGDEFKGNSFPPTRTGDVR